MQARLLTKSLVSSAHHLRFATPLRPLSSPLLNPILTQSTPCYRRRNSIASIPSISPSHLKQPSVLQILASKVAQATHRSGARVSRRAPEPPSFKRHSRNSYQDPRWNESQRKVIFWGIIGLNGIVYLGWQRAYYEYQHNRDASLFIWLRQNFTASLENLRSGRVWTLVTACFSHEGAAHIFMNAFTFYFMAPAVQTMLGNPGFLALYLGGGLASSLTSIWWNSSVRPKANYSSHGASGAIYAVVSYFACMAPRATFQLFGIIPMPAWVFVSGVFCIDFYSALTNKQAGTDTAGHIGGIIGGIGFFLARALRVF